uniref:Uncharacterized protein n=1 Tax=Anguilla anguilla TaxID=7936 RepID=A0A0E9SFJ1_ANGAN
MIKVKIKNKQKKILQLLKISTFCVHIHTTWPNYEKQAQVHSDTFGHIEHVTCKMCDTFNTFIQVTNTILKKQQTTI